GRCLSSRLHDFSPRGVKSEINRCVNHLRRCRASPPCRSKKRNDEGGAPSLRGYFLAATCLRRRSSCSLSSGVSSAPKSSASNTWRISTSAPPPKGLRLSHSIASSIDLTCHNQKPAISSLLSVNGPSVTVGLVPENLTRLPFELG